MAGPLVSRLRNLRLKLEGEELAKYGPAKPIDQQGIDQYADQAVLRGANYQQDPTGRRTGQGKLWSALLSQSTHICVDMMGCCPTGPEPAAAKTLLKCLDDAECLAHKVSCCCLPSFACTVVQFADEHSCHMHILSHIASLCRSRSAMCCPAFLCKSPVVSFAYDV